DLWQMSIEPRWLPAGAAKPAKQILPVARRPRAPLQLARQRTEADRELFQQRAHQLPGAFSGGVARTRQEPLHPRAQTTNRTHPGSSLVPQRTASAVLTPSESELSGCVSFFLTQLPPFPTIEPVLPDTPLVPVQVAGGTGLRSHP